MSSSYDSLSFTLNYVEQITDITKTCSITTFPTLHNVKVLKKQHCYKNNGDRRGATSGGIVHRVGSESATALRHGKPSFYSEKYSLVSVRLDITVTLFVRCDISSFPSRR